MFAPAATRSAPALVETDIPARLDRLGWGRFHTLVVVALGITWILDGLEVTLAGAVSGALKESPQLAFSNADVGLASTAYLGGAVLGALVFGWLTDRLGRKRLFFITLAVYLVATAATALSWNVWRFAFLIGALLGLVIFVMRLWIPESPRWLMTHGRLDEAEAILDSIEDEFRRRGHRLPPGPFAVIRLKARRFTPIGEVARTLFHDQRRRTLVGLSLMAAQAFFYNAIFFTYALVLTDFYGIRADRIGWYLLPFAAGNFLGPVVLGRLFDTIGRRVMIAVTYALSGLLLAGAGYLFAIGALSATGQTVAWMVIFFFASAAASSSYLTVSEIFPLEIRAL